MTGRAGEWGRGCCWQGVVGAGLPCRSGYHAVLAVNDALRSLARRLRRSSIIDGCAATWGAGTLGNPRGLSATSFVGERSTSRCARCSAGKRSSGAGNECVSYGGRESTHGVARTRRRTVGARRTVRGFSSNQTAGRGSACRTVR